MNWVLVLWYLTNAGNVSSAQIDGLSKVGCSEQALRCMSSKLPIIAVCIEKR